MSEIKIIHSVPEMVDWVGFYDQDKLIRMAPLFKPEVSAVGKGCILLVDLARDLTLATNYSGGKISIPNVHTLGDHLQTHFGTKLNHLIGKPIGTTNSRLVAKHITKVLRANNLGYSNQIDNDKGRIRYKYIHILNKIDSNHKLRSLTELAEWLSHFYTDTETKLIAK